MNLKRRIVEIAYKHKLAHLGSYLSSVDIIDKIYSLKQKNDIFILSSGHAALALYVVLEKYEGKDAEALFLKHGGHPHRDEEDGIYCSTGSLGLGLPIAIGRAIANPRRTVWVLISDGECAEGSIWESLKTIKEEALDNIEVFVNVNGYAAYKKVNEDYLTVRLKSFLNTINIEQTTVEQLPFLKGLNAHYHVMTETDYQEALNLLQ
jgi:transketolase